MPFTVKEKLVLAILFDNHNSVENNDLIFNLSPKNKQEWEDIAKGFNAQDSTVETAVFFFQKTKIKNRNEI